MDCTYAYLPFDTGNRLIRSYEPKLFVLPRFVPAGTPRFFPAAFDFFFFAGFFFGPGFR